MRQLVRPFPWAALLGGCLGIVSAALLAVSALLVALGLVFAAWTPAPLFLATRLLDATAALERSRFAELAGVKIAGEPAELRGSERARAERLIHDPVRRRWVGYGLTHWLVAALGFAAVTLLLVLPLVTVISAAAWLLWPDHPLTPIAERGQVGVLAAVVASVVSACMVLPPVLRLLADLDIALARILLRDSEEERLERRVGELVQSRRRTVLAADTERLKLERDLHDGAQQRLIALSILLGQAESRMASASIDEDTRGLIARARRETAETIDELRTLTRGLRPPILESRGLDAALSGVAARLGLTVQIKGELTQRPDPTVEAVVYFAVAEALTNVAKHAGGRSAAVELRQMRDLLRVVVSDDGPGGAVVGYGTGLSGIADRLSGVDGRLFLSSPPGGPTTLTMEVPCGSS